MGRFTRFGGLIPQGVSTNPKRLMGRNLEKLASRLWKCLLDILIYLIIIFLFLSLFKRGLFASLGRVPQTQTNAT